MEWVQMALGGVALVFGRRLFWLFVAILGFLLAAEIAASMVSGESRQTVILVAVGAGIVGGLLAVVLQRLAFGVAGMLAGAYLTLLLAEAMQWEEYVALIAIGVGLICGIAAYKASDWIIIVVSSLAGAAAIAVALPLRPVVTGAVFGVLAIAGIAIQGRQQRDAGRPRKRR